MKKTRRKMARLAKSGTDVVAVDMPDGSTEFSGNPKMAAQLTTTATEIIETKAVGTSVEPQSWTELLRDAVKAAKIGQDQRKPAHIHIVQGESTVPLRAAAARAHALRVGEELPSDVARRKAKQKRRLGVPESYQPKAVSDDIALKGAIMNAVANTLGAIVGYVESGRPITSEMKSALDDLAVAIKAQKLSDADEWAALDVIERVKRLAADSTSAIGVEKTSADMVAEHLAFVHQHRAPTSRQIVNEKFALIVAREPKTTSLVERMFDQSFVMPIGFSSIEQVEFQLERAHKAAHPTSIRKFTAT
jgi:hypothetical protein